MARSKQTIACDITPKVREQVLERDGKCCVVCGDRYNLELAHYIPRSQGGLGIKENLITLCQYHHRAYDGAYRENYRGTLRKYLAGWYVGWNEENLKYNKYAWLKETNND